MLHHLVYTQEGGKQKSSQLESVTYSLTFHWTYYECLVYFGPF